MGRICLIIINCLFILAPIAKAQPTDEELMKEYDELLLWVQSAIGTERFERIRLLALTQMQEGNFASFDPLVGDTSCELRAMMGTIYRNAALNEWEKSLVALTFLLGTALDTKRNVDGFNTHVRGGENKLEKIFETFVFQATGQAKKKLITSLQRAVAIGSVLFARQQARLVGGSRGASLQDLFQNQCRLDNFRRPIVSCLGICHLLLERARICRFPIVLRLRLAGDTVGDSLGTITIAYAVNANNQLVPLPPTASEGNPTVVVVEALTTLFNNPNGLPPTPAFVEAFVGGMNFEALLTLDSILHPQFAGNIKDTPLDASNGNSISREWQAMRDVFAEEIPNVRMIQVDHVYADTLTNAQRYNPFDAMVQPAQIISLTNALYFPARIVPGVNQIMSAALNLANALKVMSNQLGGSK